MSFEVKCMFLSRIKLDLTNRKTMMALANPNIFHAAIDRAEGESRSRKLWRTDSLNGSEYLLILSREQIDFSSVAKQFSDSEPETKSYDALLARCVNGSVWRFKLKANPTVKKFDPLKKKSVNIPHITPEHQLTWLLERAEKNGFAIEPNEAFVTKSTIIDFKKTSGGPHVKILAVTFEGRLTVTDEERFRSALISGIGREKAYGLGMLTIVSFTHACGGDPSV